MPYQTGQATSPANLRSSLYTFATANGWVDTAGVLSRGSNYVRIVAVDTESMTIEGDTDGTFTGGACGQSARIYVASTSWPVTYRFFTFGSPDFFACVVQYDVSRVQMMWFGDVAKYGTWTGGNWFGASHSEASLAPNLVYLTALTSGGTYVGTSNVFGNGPAAPFWGTENRDQWTGSIDPLRASFLHAEVDGHIWPGSVGNEVWPSFPELADPLHQRQPNLWNSHAVLLPIWLFFPRPDSFYSPLGHVERMRTIRVANYNLGDVITLGPDRWMVFPWHLKDVTAPDGGLSPSGDLAHTGTFGCAVAYDGP